MEENEEKNTAPEEEAQTVPEKQPEAKLIFITPWTSTDGDLNSKLPYAEKLIMNQDYSDALKKWCSESGNTYINPNKYITDKLYHYPHGRYLTDFIHPNAQKGVQLYSESVLMCTNSEQALFFALFVGHNSQQLFYYGRVVNAFVI